MDADRLSAALKRGAVEHLHIGGAIATTNAGRGNAQRIEEGSRVLTHEMYAHNLDRQARVWNAWVAAGYNPQTWSIDDGS